MASAPKAKPAVPNTSNSTLGAKKASSAKSQAVKTTLGPRGHNIDAKKAGITPVQ